LAVVHGIVKDHGGAVTVESKLGEGTSFHIYIPAIKSLAAEERVLEANHPGGSERILLVDDEQGIVNVGRLILERLGYEVVACTNSAAALEKFRSARQPFDLVVTDLTMPGMTGLELARQMLAGRPATPIILCTGYTEHGIEEKARELGIRKIFLKPITVQELSIAIREVMTKHPD
jgi:two-component system, cell cycle sensor histidine kinase and response regulator CckA